MNSRETGVIAWFTRNPVAANLLMALLVIAGVLTARDIRKESFPDMATMAVNVTVSYPGATPSGVEDGVLVKIENALKGLDGVKRIRATAYEGYGNVRIQAKNNVNMEKFKGKISSRVDSIGSFPVGAERPDISEEVMKSEVLWLTLSGDLAHSEMKSLAESLKDRLISEVGIGQVSLEGVREPEIDISVDQEILVSYGLTLEEVREALENGSAHISGGTLRREGGEMRISIGEKPLSAEEFRSIPVITRRSGARVLLSDIAVVTDGFSESDEFLRVNGKEAVGIQVFRSGDESTLRVAEDVKAFAEKVRPELPDSVSLEVLADMSVMLKNRIDLMLRNMAMGTILVFISLALFLRVRIAFWVMAGIPVCFLGTLWVMPMLDATVNMITLYGFILVLGIMVDDAIVVGESVHEEMAKNGPGALSVIRGTRAVAVPVTCGVLTTVAAFIPMLAIPGINGKLWAGIAWVVILALLFSLLESKLILPAHLAGIMPETDSAPGRFSRFHKAVDRGLGFFLGTRFRPFLELAIKYRYLTLSIFIAVMILTAGSIRGGIVRVVFFPQMESDILQADMEMAAGTPKKDFFAATARIESAVFKVNSALRKENGMGEDPIKAVLSYASGTRKAGFFLELSPNENRGLSASQIMGRLRRAVGTIPGVLRLSFSAGFDDTGSPINFRIRGRDEKELAAAAMEIRNALSSYEGVIDIRDTQSGGKPELRLFLKPGAAALGISRMDLARQVRSAFYGAQVMKLQRGRDEIEVNVLYPENRRKSMADLNNMRLRTSDGRVLPFSSVVEVKLSYAPDEITRINGERIVIVEAGVEKGLVSPGDVIRDMEEKVIPKIVSERPGVRFSLGGEAEEKASTMGSMKRNAVLALVIIYALMAVPLKSYLQPLVIMAAIPFGVVGAVLGHMLFGLPVSILSLMGIIALAGVVVNDSLVLVEGINRFREEGQSLDEALVSAGVRRFRPIFLTSVTTFLGLAPMVMEKSLQAQFLIPMAVSLAFGILFATGVTLVFIPSLYRIGGDMAHITGWGALKVLGAEKKSFGLRRPGDDPLDPIL